MTKLQEKFQLHTQELGNQEPASHTAPFFHTSDWKMHTELWTSFILVQAPTNSNSTKA